ncbi:hypothetical protein ADUPG1_004125, partial [Aduncisulcus paluster]
PSLGCRSVWYGDECDDMYSVHIPDKVFRGKVCDAAGYGDTQCDITEFELAGLTGQLDVYNIHVSTFEGGNYFLNVDTFMWYNTDSTSLLPSIDLV